MFVPFLVIAAISAPSDDDEQKETKNGVLGRKHV